MPLLHGGGFFDLSLAVGSLELFWGHHAKGAVEAAAGCFEHATSQLRDRTGLQLGKRQVEQLAVRAAVDFDACYAEQTVSDRPPEENDVLVLSADGKGIVMRADALRDATARAAQRPSPKLKARLSRARRPIASGSRKSALSMTSPRRRARQATCSPLRQRRRCRPLARDASGCAPASSRTPRP